MSEGEFATSILDDYAKCKKTDNFGIGGSVLCDAEGTLKPGTKNQLNKLLDDLQSKVTCNCDNGCSRGNDLTSDFVGLLIVSNTNKTKAALRPLSESAQFIYEDSLLGNETCDNGLLIVYLEDQQKLATYRGGGNFLLLTDNDVNKLHKASNSQQFSETDQAALRYLLTHYDTIVEGQEINRSDSFTPYFGLLIALILVFLILTCLIACCLSRICSCCKNRPKRKDKYNVTPISTYKPPPVEPIYIVTPPPSHRPPHPEGIYSSPFHGSPLPSTHRPSSFSPRPGSGGSRPITPSSTHRTKIYSVASTNNNNQPKSSTPTPKDRSTAVTRSQSASSKQHNQILPMTTPPMPSPEMPHPNPQQHSPIRPSRSSPVAGRRGDGDSPSDISIDLPFLDPNRPREIQTKKDYLY
uniref:TPM domain-containing protein n=1 Tax=Panagrolaimus sp. PS1159 TaxID=55785 RepID=A0AC35FY76_9BILA